VEEMRAQIQVISASIAFTIIAIAVLVLFTQIYSHTGVSRSYEVVYDIPSILRQRPYWTAKDLAHTILNTTGAVYCYVSIKEVDLANNQVVSEDNYEISPLTIPEEQLYIRSFVYSKGTIMGTVLTYYVRVGYK
jgi:D-alanyl-lipoteichoic acid acyltransferase DltB (MBOAT superfamily)